MNKQMVFWFCGISAIVILLTVLSYKYCSSETKTWINKVEATMQEGTPIEIIVYDEPLSDGGFVINVHRNDDPSGKCWGTIIYPKRYVE